MWGHPLEGAARAWLAEDPDQVTRDELQAILRDQDAAALEDRFGDTLTFGTAGIRGRLGAGPNRMNRSMIHRITAGLASRIAAAPDASERVVIVGRDARHNSDVFLQDTVAVLAGAGLHVAVFSDVVPTPVLAWACRDLDAIAGVMITASHNPPADNGYKVYVEGGSQILTPLDEEIAQAIAAVGALSDIPTAPADSSLISQLDPQTITRYIGAVTGIVTPGAPRELRIAYTPLHGVARDVCVAALAAAGFTDVHVVAAQAEPDPDFPTVAFPNPEEPGALDQAIELATRVSADVVLANDPDGDRIAVGIPSADGWHLLSGDDVGCLLGEDLLATNRASTPGLQDLVATTVVSSSLLGKIAAHHGARYAETLTGFKWLSARAAELEDDAAMVLSYEQALGVSVGDIVRDKDGISGALAVADLAARLRAQNRDLGDALDDLYRRHGAHITGGSSLPLADDDLVDLALGRLRDRPPAELSGSPVIERWDHDAGVMMASDGSIHPIDTPATPLIRLVAEDGSRVMVRPSGTEPKLKLYAEAVVRDPSVPAARARAGQRVQELLSMLRDVVTGDGSLS